MAPLIGLHCLPAVMPGAAPLSVEKALSLLKMLGIPPRDALLVAVGGVFLQRALESAGVPASHTFQREVRDAVRSLSQRPGSERAAAVGALRRVIAQIEDDQHDSSPAECLAPVLQQLGVGARSLAAVMAPLLASAVIQRAGVPSGHPFILEVAGAARVAIRNARSLEEVTYLRPPRCC